MRRRKRFAGGSLALRLSAIALVPMIALGAFGFDRVEQQEASVHATHALAEDVAMRRNVAAVIAPAALERVTLSGLAQIDSIGLDRSLVASFTGIDLEDLYLSNIRLLDDALFQLRTFADDTQLSDGTLLHLRIADVSRELRDVRQQAAAQAGDRAAIDTAFDGLDSVLAMAVEQIDPAGIDSVATSQALDRLRGIDAVLHTATALIRATADGFITAADGNSAILDIATAAAVHGEREAALAGTLEPADRDAFMAIEASLLPPSTELLAGAERPDANVSFAADDVEQIARLLLNQFEYLDALEAFSAELHGQTLLDATERSTNAASAARTTKVVIGLIGLGALTMTLFVMVTTTRPLSQLSRRAADIADGEIRGEPLALAGPSVVRNVTQSMNDMLVTLSAVDDQIGKMSNGDIGGAADIELPGAIGVSMRQSVARLSNMTEELAHQAHHDLLTGLPNRLAAMDRLRHMVSSEAEFALLFVDIDGFKGVNDTHGHSTGDEVLRSVADRLAGAIRLGEFVARLGGDEFVIIMERPASVDEVLQLGRRVIDEIEMPYHLAGEVFSLSASVGVVESEPGMTPVDALHQADSALYLAKQRGRGRVERFDLALQQAIEHEADLALALRHGVRNGELELYLQPVMNLTTKRMDHAEALVRWNRPGIGIVLPGEFIPIAERSSLIFEIEQWVLDTTCVLLAEQRRLDPSFDITIAVNVSGRHLIEGELLTDLEKSLHATGADPSLLEFELTETRMLEDLERATEILNTVRARGISIAVDDF